MSEIEDFKARAIAKVAMAHEPGPKDEEKTPETSEVNNALEMLKEFYSIAQSMGSQHQRNALRACTWINRLVAVVELPDTSEELQFDAWIDEIAKDERKRAAKDSVV